MKNLDLNKMEALQGGGCGTAIIFGFFGAVILGLATAAAPVMSGYTVAAAVNIAGGVATACTLDGM